LKDTVTTYRNPYHVSHVITQSVFQPQKYVNKTACKHCRAGPHSSVSRHQVDSSENYSYNSQKLDRPFFFLQLWINLNNSSNDKVGFQSFLSLLKKKRYVITEKCSSSVFYCFIGDY